MYSRGVGATNSRCSLETLDAFLSRWAQGVLAFPSSLAGSDPAEEALANAQEFCAESQPQSQMFGCPAPDGCDPSSMAALGAKYGQMILANPGFRNYQVNRAYAAPTPAPLPPSSSPATAAAPRGGTQIKMSAPPPTVAAPTPRPSPVVTIPAPALTPAPSPVVTIPAPEPSPSPSPSTSSGPAPAPAAAAPLTATATLINLTGNNNGYFDVGDEWQLNISGAPNQPVSALASRNNLSMGVTEFGSTDSTGLLVLTGVITEDQVGQWVENWTVGDQLAPQVSFYVYDPNANNEAVTPVDPGMSAGVEVSTATNWLEEHTLLSLLPNWVVLAGAAIGAAQIFGGKHRR